MSRWLRQLRRLHMNHGPIDLIVEAFGPEEERRAAYAQAAARFQTILEELVAELPELRRPASRDVPRVFAGPTARRMEAACVPLAERFITPMVAVAGAVADEMLTALVAGRTLKRAYVNDGGDIAIHLAPGQSMRLAIAGTGHGLSDRVHLHPVMRERLRLGPLKSYPLTPDALFHVAPSRWQAKPSRCSTAIGPARPHITAAKPTTRTGVPTVPVMVGRFVLDRGDEPSLPCRHCPLHQVTGISPAINAALGPKARVGRSVAIKSSTAC
jgi:hypothetical protein